MQGKLICNLYALPCWQIFIAKSGCYIQYVVETSLGIPTDGADCVGAQSVWLEMCGFGYSQHP
jgi:hypothetical protein